MIFNIINKYYELLDNNVFNKGYFFRKYWC